MTFAVLKGRKSSPNMRSTSPAPVPRGASPAPAVPRHPADVFSDVTNANAGLGIQAGPGHHGAGAGAGPGGLAKLLSFPWHRGGDKGKAPTLAARATAIAGASPVDVNAPLPSPPWTSTVQPFPRPPTHPPTRQTAPPQPPPQPVQHASAAVIPAQLTGATSASTMSTSSSFASTALFTDDWESEDGGSTQDSSIASSPEGSQPRRMWKVRDGTQPTPARQDATPYSPLRTEMSTVVEEAPESPSRKRASTPGPTSVGMMMLAADPATPPRLVHRLSASSKPSPTSPPFDPLFERAVAEGRTRTFPPSPPSPEESGDADDEVSPPRARRGMRRASLDSPQKLLGESSTELAYADGFRMRIPSIRFEGISMDAVFAEVEKKMGDEREKKANRRRTRVLSTYRPFGSDASFGSSEGTTPPSLSTSHDSFSTLDSGSPSTSSGSLVFQLNEHEYATIDRAQSTTPTPRSHHSATRPQHPRRSSSRPAPLNVAAANAVPTSAPSQRSPVGSPRTPTFSTVSARSSPTLPPKSPMSPATAAFSPSALGDAFFPMPSPALSSTSTMRGPPSPVPELWVRPPTPEREREPLPSPLPSPRLTGPMEPFTSSHPGTKVVVVQEKRQVKLSSRASTGPKRRPTLTFETVPPPAPTAPAYATPPSTPSFGNLGPVMSPCGSPARSSMGASSGDETDAEDALNSMLVRLAQPHTPPSSPSYTLTTHSSPAPLTLQALELHTSQQSLAKLAHASPPSPTTFPATPVESPTSTKRLSAAYSTASSEQRRLSSSSWPRRGGGSDSDDSAARFGDAPPTPPQIGRPRSSSSNAREAAAGPPPQWTEMAMPDEIRVTPATPSHSAQSSISSEFQASSLLPTVLLHSRLQSVEPRPGPESSSEDEPTSGEESTEGGEDGYDSMDLADLAETAIVMMGERISCGYEIGVAV